MPQRKTTPAAIATQFRRALKDGGSAEHAAGVQWFFKEEIKSYGWYTADLRRAAVRFRREVRKEHGLDFLVEVADHLFYGSVLEEKIAAVFLLEKLDHEFGEREFNRVRVLARPHQQLGRSRCAGARPDRSHDRVQTCTRRSSFPLGEGRPNAGAAAPLVWP